jgi:hypothetical protein
LATISPSVSWAAEADLVVATCSAGMVTMTAKAPWHTNPNAPWAWNKGSLVSKSETQVRFKGSKCEGTVKAFIASRDQLKGPISVAIK